MKLVHHGRKSGKRFEVQVWHVELDGVVWIGSLDSERNWVRNVAAAGAAELDFGAGPVRYAAERIDAAADIERFHEAVRRKYPLRSRLIAFMARGGQPTAFRMRPADD